MRIRDLLNKVEVARDGYKTKYRELKQNKDNAIKDANARYIGEELQKQISMINQNFNELAEKERNEVFNFLMPEILAFKENEIKKATVIDSDTMSKLSALVNLPISTIEAETLTNEYAGKNYYTDKLLLTIFERNAIDTTSEKFAKIQKSLDTRMEILTEIQNQFTSLLDGYTGNDVYVEELLLNNQMLLDSERTYNNGVLEDAESPEELAKLTLASISENNSSLMQCIMLKNALSNADDTTKLAMKNLIVSGKSDLKANTLEFSNIKSTLDSIENVSGSEGVGTQETSEEQ